MYDSRLPFNDLPPIPVERLETPRTLKCAIAASRNLAMLNASGPLIPNQTVLLRAMLLQEAKASSEIENIVTTNDILYQSFEQDPEVVDPATKEVLKYGDALWAGFEALKYKKSIRPSMVIDIAKAIKGPEIGLRSKPGTVIKNARTGQVVYTPPEGKERLYGLVEDVCRFISSPGKVDPLIAMAAAHRQFEAIHPFPDGNGRTGRVLNILALVQSGLLDLPVLYLSSHIIREKPTYYRLLRSVTEKDDWESWICFMLDAVSRTSVETHQMLMAVQASFDESVEKAKAGMAKGYSRELMEVVFSQVYTRISHLEAAGIARRNTASVYLQDLERIGLLESVKRGRDVLYRNNPLLRALALPGPERVD